MKKKIAVIGLGIMGHGIAHNFLKNDYEVYVWNRHAEKAEDLKGAVLATSPQEASNNADIIFEVTANPTRLDEAIVISVEPIEAHVPPSEE